MSVKRQLDVLNLISKLFFCQPCETLWQQAEAYQQQNDEQNITFNKSILQLSNELWVNIFMYFVDPNIDGGGSYDQRLSKYQEELTEPYGKIFLKEEIETILNEVRNSIDINKIGQKVIIQEIETHATRWPTQSL